MVNIFKLPIYNCSPNQIIQNYLIEREKRVQELEMLGWEKSRASDHYTRLHIKMTDPDNYIIGYLYVDYLILSNYGFLMLFWWAVFSSYKDK